MTTEQAEELNRREMILGEAEQAIMELIRSMGDPKGEDVSRPVAELIVIAIAAGEIPHVRMEF